MELIPWWVWLVQGGAVALLAWVARLVYTGRLVPRATHDRIWSAYEAELERARVLSDQLGKILAAIERLDERRTGTGAR